MMISQFFHALLMTILIEAIVVTTMIRLAYRIPATSISWSKLLFCACFSSFATLPYLWFVLSNWITDFRLLAIIGEPLVVLVEGAFYWVVFRFTIRRAMLISLIANALSFFIGWAIGV